MDKIKAQADKLWRLIANPATGETFQKTITLTWSLLKETGLLLWLVLCLGLVLGDWFWKYSYQAGQRARIWVNDLQTPKPSEAAVEVPDASPNTSKMLSTTGKSLLAAGQASIKAVLNTAKGQLGIEIPPEPEHPKSINHSISAARSVVDASIAEIAIAEAPILERPIAEPPVMESSTSTETAAEPSAPSTEGLRNEPKASSAEATSNEG